jgi:hypothetical protein
LFNIDSICERSNVVLFYLIDETSVNKKDLCVKSLGHSIKVAPGELSDKDLCVNKYVHSLKVAPNDLGIIEMGDELNFSNDCLLQEFSNCVSLDVEG